MDEQKTFDIRDRAFEFAVRVIKFCQFWGKQAEVSKSLSRQLPRSATSIGANFEEAHSAQSRADFISKNPISLKEARETSYWLRLIPATANFDNNVKKGVNELKDESSELMRIIASIVVSAKKND
ncbi:MAG: four helix bundle protein [Acidobacteriota bacterium]|nr:four helix bundle protein [Acidobacteriota bacterium]